MPTNVDLRPLFRRALDLMGTALAQVAPPDLARPTPCAGWDLRTLLGHVIGQNHGFAQAVETPDAPLAAFAHRLPDPGGISEAWQASADHVAASFDAARLDRRVLLVELSTKIRFPVATVVGFQLLDTVVHTWDVATALGEPFRLDDDELLLATLVQAQEVPDGPERQRPDAAFAPALPYDGTDDWMRTLALLGREETVSPNRRSG